MAFKPTDEQQAILDIKEGLHLVLAPPGSGKTELLAQRVYNAKNSGFEDNEIICLTFTNRAAKGMNERINQKYPNNNIIIGNIHHFCSTFLFKNKLIPLNTSILDEEDADNMIGELKEVFKYPPKEVQKLWDSTSKNYIEQKYPQKVYNQHLLQLATYIRQKYEYDFPEELFMKPKAYEIPAPWEAKKLCEAYNKDKKDNHYLDFDDLLTLTYYYLTHRDKKELQLSQFKWLQVDEVQDLNPLQWAIVQEITAPDALVVYFGDYEQAIFSFMGAKLDSLHNIEKICKRNQKNGIHNLVKNFRSPSYLLDVYVKYAETHWTPTWKKRPVPNIQQEAPENSLCLFKIEGCFSNKDEDKDEQNTEVAYISDSIIPKLSIQEGNTAILVRFNNSADLISNKLTKGNIAHFKISGFDLFRRKVVKGLMAFFYVFLSEYDRLSWARIFYEFGILKTLKESRTFINELHSKGFTPVDIIEYDGKSSRLIDFFDIFENREMVVFDTETTGLDTENDDIIQIAAVKIVNGKIEETFEVYINTEKDVTESEKIHHISKAKLDTDGVSHEKGISDFMQFIGHKAVLVAHNIRYDYSILTHNLRRYCNASLTDYCQKQFDSITIAKLIYPNFSSYKLKDLLDFLKVEGVNSHNALDDVKATVSLIEKLHSDYSVNLKFAQMEYLSNSHNTLIFNKFIAKFKPLYDFIISKLNLPFTLNQTITYYFDYYKELFCPKKDENKTKNQEEEEEKIKKWLQEWDNEMQETDKLLKHIEFYTNKEEKMILKQRIEKYIPEYQIYKESDLYLGTEKVVVSTVYKAKGLEFDNVVIAEATDETYPFLAILDGILKKMQNNKQVLEEECIVLEHIQKILLEIFEYEEQITIPKSAYEELHYPDKPEKVIIKNDKYKKLNIKLSYLKFRALFPGLSRISDIKNNLEENQKQIEEINKKIELIKIQKAHQIKEDARTFYVAMTRAKKKLYISHSTEKTIYYTDKKTGEPKDFTVDLHPSRYIAPIREYFISQLDITYDYEFVLTDYNNLIIKELTPLYKAVYLLFLIHKDGIRLKSFSDFKPDLLRLYKEVAKRNDYSKNINTIENLCNPADTSYLNQTLSKINKILKDTLPPHAYETFAILGERGMPKRIALDRNLVVLPSIDSKE